MRKIIEGNVDLRGLYLTELFDLSDVEVEGIFNCSRNTLSNLKGAPHTVGGDFSCNKNNLTSLKGAPHTVNGSFLCDVNNLTSLEGAPQTVGGYFYCYNNPLTSLKGIPKTVNYNFYIDEVLKDRFPEEYIRSLCKIKGRVVYA